MASIIKRRKKFSVVYRYTDENGNERQKWESFDTMAEAKKRKLEVEFKQENNEFIAPSMKTINDLLAEYMAIYGVNTWAISTYEGRKSPDLKLHISYYRGYETGGCHTEDNG